MQGITPALMFNEGAEEPVRFYTSIFKNSSIESEEAGPDGKHLASNFTLNGVKFLAISGGPPCKPSMSTSFMINCADQAEVDYYWEKLSEGGEEQACGWLSDKFGVSWQVIPEVMMSMLSSGNKKQSEAVFNAMLQMVKLDVATLQKAYDSAS